MTTSSGLVTTNFNVISASMFKDSFNTNNYFVFAGRHIPYPTSDSNIIEPNNSIQSTTMDIYDNMIFYKRVEYDDVQLMIKNIEWVANTKFDMYEHDIDLTNKSFFVVIDDVTEYNVYKCLDNSANGYSTVAPFRNGDSTDLDVLETGDGYKWKYMFTITSTNYDKFATSNFIPVTANTEVIAGATPGTIETIKILDGGKGYSNYITSGVFKSGDIALGGVNTIFKAPETAQAIDDYYLGCILRMTSGSIIDEYRRIVGYVGVGSQKKFILNSSFSVNPSVNDEYQIYPYAYVWGDGNETEVADAMCLVDSSSGNSIISIEVLSTGENYRYGESHAASMTDTIPPTISSIILDIPSVISNGINFRAAELKPIISPPNGHGSDPYNELNANKACVSNKFIDSESGTIPIENDFRQVGLLKDPTFDNVSLVLKQANTIGSFSIGDTLYQFRQFKLQSNVEITSGNNLITKSQFGEISNTVSILNGGIAYDSTVDTLVFDNTGTSGSGIAGIFANNGSGTITSLSFSNNGVGYIIPPTVTISTVTGSNASIILQLTNPEEPTFDDAFVANDYVLVSSNTQTFISKVSSITSNYQIMCTSNATFTSDNAEVSALILEAKGTVVSSSAGGVVLDEVSGQFVEEHRVIGINDSNVILSSGATSVIQISNSSITAIKINDRAAADLLKGIQATRLIGSINGANSSFTEDELVTQDSLVSYAQPRARVHHSEYNGANSDVLYLTNMFGNFNLDTNGITSVVGETSESTLDNLLNKYNGDLTLDSGNVLYYENISAITRNVNKSEIIKMIFSF